VLVDDGSTDATPVIAARAARDDPRIRVLSVAHRGLVAALEAGLAVCRGDLVARMDADDLMHRRRLECQVAALEARTDWSAVGCGVRLFPRAGLGPGYRRYERWLNAIVSERDLRREAFVECPVAHPALTIRRERLAALGYRDRGWPEDYDLVLRLLTAGERIGVVPRRLLAWRQRPERLSRTSGNYADGRFTACKAWFLADSFLADAAGYVLWGYGGTGQALHRELSRLGKRATHIVELHPGRLGNRIHGAAVVPPDVLRELRGVPIVVSVAGEIPRRQIRNWLDAAGRTELRDYVCAA